MSKKNYDLIATVDIDIKSPIVDDTSFDHLLIVGPAPSVAPTVAPPDFGAYRSLDEVVDTGWSLTTDPVAKAAQAAFAQTPRPSVIYIAPIKTTDTTTVGEGNEAQTYVDPLIAIGRAIDSVKWYVLCTAGVDEARYESIAKFIENYDKMFVYTDTAFLRTGSHAVGAVYNRTVGVFGMENGSQTTAQLTEVEHDANLYINCAFTARWLNYEPGSETTAFKTLTSVYPSELTSTQLNNLVDGNLCYFITVGNKNITMSGKTRSGEWADVIRFRDWLKNDMQVRVVNLFIINTKIPYTDDGIAIIHNAMIASLKRGQIMGGICRDEFDEDGNRIPGFATSVPLASSLTPSERASRILKGLKFRARLAGAIHFAEIKGSLVYEL